MVNVALSLVRVLVALVLVGLNGFFVAAEFAFVKVRTTAVDQAVADDRPGSGALKEAVTNLDDYLAVSQLGITLASLGLGWIGEPAVAALLEPLLASYLSAATLHLVSFAVGFGVITFLHVVFGELAPKTIAIARAEKLSLFVAPIMRIFYYVFLPGLVVFNGTANAFTRMLGVPPASETEETLEEREIRQVLSRSGEAGQVDKAEVEMIDRVFELDDTVVRETMVPRPDVVSVSADTALDDLRAVIRETGHTRYPVLGSDDADQVLGFVDAKDVLAAMDSQIDATAGDLTREMAVVPETTRVNDLLVQFQDDQQQMAAVVDEWGVFEGIVTVEDVVEEIVGDLRDDFDVAETEPTIDERGGAYDVDGSVPITELNERLGTDFQSAAYETVGGLVMDELGRVPQVGDRVAVDGYDLEVTDVDGTRVATVVVQQNGESEPASATDSGDE